MPQLLLHRFNLRVGRPRLRRSEWVLVCFFAYVALIAPWFTDRPGLKFQPLFIFCWILALFICLSILGRTRAGKIVQYIRDWIPLGVTLVAFREMELFIPRRFPHTYEAVWVKWDHLLLAKMGLSHFLESLGPLIPLYLELCYLLVYAIGIFCVALLWAVHRRKRVDRFLVVYLLGTLGAYALFPFFPSHPPRLLYPNLDLPGVSTFLRSWNLWILSEGTIHVSVFPSAHVSSAFSGSWGIFIYLRKKHLYGWGLLLYAVSVSIATIYGRYHYAADVAAGFAVSLVAGLYGVVELKARTHRWRDSPST